MKKSESIPIIRKTLNNNKTRIYKTLENHFETFPPYQPSIFLGNVRFSDGTSLTGTKTFYRDPGIIVLSQDTIISETKNCNLLGLPRTIEQTTNSKLAAEYTHFLESSHHNFTLQEKTNSYMEKASKKKMTRKDLMDFLVGKSKAEAFSFMGKQVIEKEMGYFSKEAYYIQENNSRRHLKPDPITLTKWGTAYVAFCHFIPIFGEMSREEFLNAFKEDPFDVTEKERIEVGFLLNLDYP